MRGKKLIATVAISAFVLATQPQPARAGGLVLGSTEITQLLNHVELINQYIQQIQQYETQLNQWQNEITQAKMLPQQTFSQVENTLTGMQSVVQGGNSLSYAMGNLDSQFTSKFSALGYAPSGSFAQRYATWSQTAMDTTRKTLAAAGYQNQTTNTQAALIARLQSDAQSSQGQMQAIQTGNEIAAEQANQLLQLRQLMMADMQSKAAFQAQQIAQQDEANRSMGFYNSADLYNGDYRQH